MFKRIKQWFSSDSPTETAPFGFFFSGNKFAGVNVTEKAVATHADVYTCIKTLSSSIGNLPIQMFRVRDDLTEEIKDTVTARIFTARPCKNLTTQEWLEMAIACLALRGNFYCEIVRNRYGNVAQIIPFYNQRGISVHQDKNGDLVYTYITNDNKTGKYVKTTFTDDKILHLKINSFDGILGTSPLTHCAKELGISLATENHTASIFENDATPRAVIETEQSFGNNIAAFNRLKDGINETLRGSENSGKIAILEDGAKLRPIALTPVDAQLIEQRKLSRQKVYAMFGVPLSKGDQNAGGYSSTAENNRAFLSETLSPYLTHIESKLNELMPSNFYVKFDVSKFVKADFRTLSDVAGSLFDHGFISINEGRQMLGLPPLENGDIHAVRTNNIVFGTIDEFTAEREQPAPQQPQEQTDENPEENSV